MRNQRLYDERLVKRVRKKTPKFNSGEHGLLDYCRFGLEETTDVENFRWQPDNPRGHLFLLS